MTLDELAALGMEIRRLGWPDHLESLRRLYADVRRGSTVGTRIQEASLLASAIGVGAAPLTEALRCPSCPQTGPRSTDGARITLNLPDRWVSTCPECGAQWVTREAAILQRTDKKRAPSVSASPLRLLKSGVDTLRIGVYFEWKPEVKALLEEQASEARRNRTRPVFEIGEVPHELRILPRSASGAPYSIALSASDWDTSVSTWKMGTENQTPSLMCTFRSQALADHGWRACVDRWRKLMLAHAGRLRPPVKMKNGRVALPELVSRLDVHVDIQGWSVDGGALKHVTTQAAPGTCKENLFETTEAVRAMGISRACGYEFGTRGSDGLFCRVYRKDIQVASNPEAQWVLGTWRSAGHIVGSPVTRVEFEIGRERLKEWRLSKLETLERNLSESMARLTTDWIRFGGPHAEAWKIVSRAFASTGD